MRHLIEVTAEDIARGMRGKYEFCPVAIALRRIPAFADAQVYFWGIVLGNEGPVIDIPEIAQKFIGDYDNRRGSPQPFTFEIELA